MWSCRWTATPHTSIGLQNGLSSASARQAMQPRRAHDWLSRARVGSSYAGRSGLDLASSLNLGFDGAGRPQRELIRPQALSPKTFWRLRSLGGWTQSPSLVPAPCSSPQRIQLATPFRVVVGDQPLDLIAPRLAISGHLEALALCGTRLVPVHIRAFGKATIEKLDTTRTRHKGHMPSLPFLHSGLFRRP
jgi:hypothetical protein